MEAPHARPPPPPKPKAKPKPGDNLNSSRDNLVEPQAAPSQPQHDVAKVNVSVAPVMPSAEPAGRQQLHANFEETPAPEVPAQPKPKTVRKKLPPPQEAPPAAPQEQQALGVGDQAGPGDAPPVKKAPAKKKVVKKSADGDGAEPGTDGAKPKKRVVKKPPRPVSTEMQMNPSAVRSRKEVSVEPEVVAEPKAPELPVSEPPSEAPQKPPVKTVRKNVKPAAPAPAETRSRDPSPAPAPPIPEASYEQPAQPHLYQPAVASDPYAASFAPMPQELDLQGPVFRPPEAVEALELPAEVPNEPFAAPQLPAKEQKKGGLLSSLRQSFSKPKAPKAPKAPKGKSKNEQSDEPVPTMSFPAVAIESPVGPAEPETLPAMHGSQPALDLMPRSVNLGVNVPTGKTKSASMVNVKTSGALQQCIVVMLDGEEMPFDVPKRGCGRDLTDKVYDYLDLVERDYFGVTYTNQKFQTWFWLHEDKPISKQLKEDAWVFRFQVKFYPPDPIMLKEELSRYQLCLQLRQDLYYHKLPCSWVTQALLGSYMVQSEIGDYDEMQHGNSIDYLRSFAFVDGQTDDLLAKIGELHRTHRGLAPSQADQRFLENAKRLELYGVDLHASRDVADIEVQIAVCHAGVVVYKDQLRLNRFAWPKILKISYKKDCFLLRIRSDRFESQQMDCSFRLANHKLAKRVWRYAVESHTFYRLKEPPKSQAVGSKSVTASMMSLISLGSSRGAQFRYSGRTLHQATATLGRTGTEAPAFERLASKRSTTGSMPNLAANVSMTLSPSQQQANANMAATSGSMASLVLPPPRVGVLQTSRSLELLNSGILGRNMTLADNAQPDRRQGKHAPPVAAQSPSYDYGQPQYSANAPLDNVDAPPAQPARYTKKSHRGKPQILTDDDAL